MCSCSSVSKSSKYGDPLCQTSIGYHSNHSVHMYILVTYQSHYPHLLPWTMPPLAAMATIPSGIAMVAAFIDMVTLTTSSFIAMATITTPMMPHPCHCLHVCRLDGSLIDWIPSPEASVPFVLLKQPSKVQSTTLGHLVDQVVSFTVERL